MRTRWGFRVQNIYGIWSRGGHGVGKKVSDRGDVVVLFSRLGGMGDSVGVDTRSQGRFRIRFVVFYRVSVWPGYVSVRDEPAAVGSGFLVSVAAFEGFYQIVPGTASDAGFSEGFTS